MPDEALIRIKIEGDGGATAEGGAATPSRPSAPSTTRSGSRAGRRGAGSADEAYELRRTQDREIIANLRNRMQRLGRESVEADRDEREAARRKQEEDRRFKRQFTAANRAIAAEEKRVAAQQRGAEEENQRREKLFNLQLRSAQRAVAAKEKIEQREERERQVERQARIADAQRRERENVANAQDRERRERDEALARRQGRTPEAAATLAVAKSQIARQKSVGMGQFRARRAAQNRHQKRSLVGTLFGPRAGAVARAFAPTKSPRKRRAQRQGAILGGLFGVLGARRAQRKHGKAGGLAAAATIGAIKGFEIALTGAITATGNFAASLISASTSPAVFMQQTGTALRSFSDKLFLLSPVVGLVGGVLGSVAQAGGALMGALDGMVKRFEFYSGGIAAAQSMAEVRQELGDLRRAQEATPDLVRYIQQRSDLQQKIENAKIEFIRTVMPLALTFMNLFESVVLPILKLIVELINKIPGVSADISSIERMMQELKEAEKAGRDVDLTQALFEGFVGPRSARGARDDKDDPFVRVPREAGTRQGF